MNQQPSCPDPSRLSALLRDTLPAEEHAQLAEHVHACERCQQTLDRMTWPDMPLPPAGAVEPEPALRKAMDRLAAVQTSSEPAPADDNSLAFLSPSELAGHLGRLGPYEVLEVIGRGGMGIVLKAMDPALQRVVAIKVLAPQMATSAMARKRFIREAQAAAAISHENVVTIYAVDEAEGLPYLVMQHVAGNSLQERLDRGGPMELTELLAIARQIAAGLAAAHAQNLIHRDIKPANILLEGSAVRITDFGLARAIGDVSLSQSGLVAGTPQYMAPEQISGGPIDHRCDLYSLGVLLFRMATGREPFESQNLSALWAQHLYERPPLPSEISPTPLPGWLEELILALLQKDPSARPRTAEEVIQRLDRGPGRETRLGGEEARLTALRRYRILDTDPEQGFDDLTSLASYVCGTPIALITLVDADRQWFKSKVGVSLRETARNISFCTHTIREPDLLMVPDAMKDKRFADSPLVRSDPHVRFYAGIPLIDPEGHALGAMCVMDRVPRQLTPDQVSALAALSRLVLTQLEMRRNLLELRDPPVQSVER
jgi:serine/threonine protein kinase